MPHKVEIDKDLLHDLYKKKQLSVKKIAQRLGYSPTCVYNNLLRHKIPIISNSQRYKGRPAWPISEEGRRKIAISKTGNKNPAKRTEVRIKISKANKGKRLSEETRQRMSKALKMRVINWGDKISAAKKKWYVSNDGRMFIEKLRHRTNLNNPMFNKSEEIKKRHWTRLSDEYKRNEIINKFRKARMLQRFPLKSTNIEIMMQEELKKRNINFITHYPILDICWPDIIIPKEKLLIQCDGDWWHANPKFYNHENLSEIQKNNVRRDTFQDAILRQNGWNIMRFWGSEITNNISFCVDRVEKFLRKEKLETGATK